MYFKLYEECKTRGKYTNEEVEKIIKDFFKKKNGTEIAPLTFQRDDELAVGAFANVFTIMIDDPDFLNSMKECYWVINGKYEECLETLKDTMKNIKI
jgi:hypothetical protein